jgi:hypothetical protein
MATKRITSLNGKPSILLEFDLILAKRIAYIQYSEIAGSTLAGNIRICAPECTVLP